MKKIKNYIYSVYCIYMVVLYHSRDLMPLEMLSRCLVCYLHALCWVFLSFITCLNFRCVTLTSLWNTLFHTLWSVWSTDLLFLEANWRSNGESLLQHASNNNINEQEKRSVANMGASPKHTPKARRGPLAVASLQHLTPAPTPHLTLWS